VYFGASNIEDYVDRDAFIDYRRFGSLDELTEYIGLMPDHEYREYQEAILRYLKSDKYAKYSRGNLAKDISELAERKMVKRKNYFLIKLKMIATCIMHPRRSYNRKQRRFLFESVFGWSH
jgi:hypothetical protein